MRVQIAPCEDAFFKGKDMPEMTTLSYKLWKNGEAIEMPFGL